MDLNRLPDDPGGFDLESDVVVCSICLDPASKNCERTVVELKCSHKFHLDCIGSAFNAKGGMECPNCRTLEIGEWQLGNGYVPPADESDEEIIAQSYTPQLVTLQWCPYNDVTPVPMLLNEGNYFANNYTQAPIPWNGPFVSANPFPAPQSPYYQGMQPGAHAVLPSLQQYFQHHLYSAPLVPPPAGTIAEPLVPLSGNGFHQHISSRNLVSRFFTGQPATPQQNFTGAGFPTAESLPNQGWEAVLPADSSRNSLNIRPQRGAGQGQQTTTWPNQP